MNPQNGHLSLGLDIGGSSVKGALVVQGDGRIPEVVARGIRPLTPGRHVDDALRAVTALADELRAGRERIDAIGVGLPGIFDAVAGTPTVLPNLPDDWIGYPLRARLEDRLGQAVHLVNDAKAFSFAEARLGAGVGARAVACVVLGTGVGGGVVLDGELWSGQGTAGELGHLTVALDGPVCGCGNTGCVEAFAGSDAIAAFGGLASAKDVFDAAALGDQRAMAAVSRAIAALGAGLSNVYIALAPDLFVIGGGVAASDLVIEPLVREVRRRVRVAPADRIRVVRGVLGRHAGAIGAALVASLEPSSSPREKETAA